MGQPTQERLVALFDYEPATGVLKFRPRPREEFPDYRSFRVFEARCAGRDAGARHSGGYISVRVDGRSYLAHRMIWIMVHGSIPNLEVDHINGVRSDNRLANLRLANKLGNSHNQAMRLANKSGFNGVCFDKRRNSWRVEAKNANRRVALSFKTKEEAIACRMGIDRAWEFDPAHGKEHRAQYHKPRPRKVRAPATTRSPAQ